jgi:hypothetical protein
MHGGVKKSDKYVAKSVQHLKNEKALASTTARSIVQNLVGKKACKWLQMGVIFHLLEQGCPKLEYAAIQPFL